MPEGKEYAPEEIAKIEEERKASDEELKREGAEEVEGRLVITEQQYEHLHKGMEAELRERRQALVDYIKERLEDDLASLNPKFQQELLKCLQGLLKLSKGKEKGEYLVDVATLLFQLGSKGEELEKGILPFTGPSMVAEWFTELSDEQRKEIEQYLEGKIEKQAEPTLEQFITERLGLKAVGSYDVDRFSDPRERLFAAGMTMLHSDRFLGDFTIQNPGKPIDSAKIQALMVEYFQNQGYEVEERHNSVIVRKEKEALLAWFSNYDDRIMFSVMRFR
jgi:hypothetical protein